MNGNYLTQEDVRRKQELEQKIDAIRSEVVSYMDKKNRQIKLLQSEIKQLEPAKKRSFEEKTEERFTKRIKTEIIEAGIPLPSAEFLTEDGCVKVFIDGICNHKDPLGEWRASFGVWWNDKHRLNVSERCKGLKQSSSHVGEIEAIIRAVRLAKENSVDKLEVNTSSEYAIKSIKQMPEWKKNGWKTANGNMVRNKEYLVYLDRLLTDGRCIEVKWKQVNRFDLRSRGNLEAMKLSKKAVKK